jgi:hypothetical protein
VTDLHMRVCQQDAEIHELRRHNAFLTELYSLTIKRCNRWEARALALSAKTVRVKAAISDLRLCGQDRAADLIEHALNGTD